MPLYLLIRPLAIFNYQYVKCQNIPLSLNIGGQFRSKIFQHLILITTAIYPIEMWVYLFQVFASFGSTKRVRILKELTRPLYYLVIHLDYLD